MSTLDEIAARDAELPLPDVPTMPFQQAAADRRHLLALVREAREALISISEMVQVRDDPDAVYDIADPVLARLTEGSDRT